jgi:multiple sugar transport system permease protein
MSIKIIKILKSVIFYLLISLVVIYVVFPFLWMVFGSVKKGEQLLQMPPVWNAPLTIINYLNVLLQTDFLKFTLNSSIISMMAVFFALIIGLPAAYSIARYNLKSIGKVILTTRMIPGISFLVPWFIIFSKMNLIDTYFGVILSHLVLTLPLIIWIMIGFFEELPIALEEAAIIEGCSKWQAFTRISIPLSKTAIITAVILGFIFSWNHFIFALILAGPRTNTLPVTVFEFVGYERIDFGGIYAAAALITAPIIIMVLIIQKHFVEGLTLGAVKG